MLRFFLKEGVKRVFIGDAEGVFKGILIVC